MHLFMWQLKGRLFMRTRVIRSGDDSEMFDRWKEKNDGKKHARLKRNV